MKHWLKLLPLAGLIPAAMAGAAPADGLIPRQAISQGLAVEIATRAVDRCAADGYAVSASIADPAGNIRIIISADGVSALSIEVARRKARTAAILRAPTADIKNAVEGAPGFGTMLNSVYSDLVFLGGGMPIMAKSGLVGAIGVGGAPGGDKDEACARAALDAVSKRLN